MDLQRDFLQYWSERAPRERRLLSAGAAFVILVVFYLLFIDPAASGIGKLQRLLPQTRAQAEELEGLVAEAKSLRSAAPSASPATADARSGIVSSLEAAGLKPAHNSPLANGDVHLSFLDVPYAKWASWLASAERTLGVHAVAVTAKATATPGNADIELSLRLPRI
jgi:general secretion pathway protein M